MSFDRIAPHYQWIERLCAGAELDLCRAAFLDALNHPRRVLIVGEGDGRFLEKMLRRYPEVEVTCVDASNKMLRLTEERLIRAGLDASRVTFVHADVLEWSPPTEKYDGIVTHFFLDCFPPDQLAIVTHRLATAARPGARWLVSDFHVPAAGMRRWRARAIIASLYLFFRVTARLGTRCLTPPDAHLTRSGFSLRERRVREWGLLHTDVWELPSETFQSSSPNPINLLPI